MAPAATATTAAAANGKHAALKNGANGANGHDHGNVHLSSADVIHLEHEYGAHK